MTLKDLIKNYSWNDVKTTLFKHYPDMRKSDEGFQIMFVKLMGIEPKENTYEIVLQTIKEEEYEAYVHVNATNIDPNATGETVGSWSLMGTPWDEWLYMPISKESEQEFSEIEILAHCLWEMSFCGFDEKDIVDFNKKLDDDAEMIKNMTEEEMKENYVCFDDINDINEDEPEDCD